MRSRNILIFSLFILIPFHLVSSFPMICEGRTEITFIPASKDSSKKILCYTPIEMDLEKHELKCDIDMKRSQPQIQVVDGPKHLYADHLFAKFEAKNNHVKLQNLSLSGSVKLIQQEFTDDNQTPHTQYILADYLDYTQCPDELYISSDPENQVYYYDDLNEYEMNAKELLVKRNPMTHKIKVNGVGPVHFSFKEDHILEMKDQIKRRKNEAL